MKALIVLGVLALTAEAAADDKKSYEVKATKYRGSYGLSCGAKGRMLKDEHRITYDGRKVWVNSMPWDWSGMLPGDAQLEFHKRQGQKTYLEMNVYLNDRSLFGTYTLFGVTPKGALCSDIVEIRGTRR